MIDTKIMQLTMESFKNKARTTLLQRLLDDKVIDSQQYADAKIICAIEYSDSIDKILETKAP